MKRKLILLTVMLIAMVSFIGYKLSMNLAEGNKMTDLTIVLDLDKAKYQSGEPIRASIRLENTGNKEITVRQRMVPNLPFAPSEVRDITFAIKGPSGEITPAFRIEVKPLAPEDFVTLSPGETIENTINIQRLYRMTDIGQYSISAIYQNNMDPGLFHRRAWKGEITSNVVVFEIVP